VSVLRVLFVLALGVCSSTPAPSQSPTPQTAPGVRPGDSLLVKVWGEPDYSGGASVDAHGLVVLPILGEISVQGRTAESLTDSLKVVYRKYLHNPSIEIKVLRRVSVSGEVARPSLYLADATLTVGDLISLAGGITPSGNRKKVMLLRGDQIVVAALGPGTVLQDSPVQSGDQIFVPQRGWLSRNGQTFFVAAVSVTTAVLVAVLVRR
jgi:protein involved in polysaccharide export with SLBB domain